MKKKLSLLLITLLLFFAHTEVNALTIADKKSLNLIESTVNKEDSIYGLPKSIVIAPVFPPEELAVSDIEWYRGMYHYMAERLNQHDFLAHFIITKDGQILQGNSTGDERRFLVEEGGDVNNPIIVLYLTNKGQSDFTINAKDSIRDLILYLANRNAINPNNVKLKTVNYKIQKEKPIIIKLDDLAGLWEVSLKDIVKDVSPQYSPIQKEYKIKVTKVILPDKQLKFGDDASIEIELKNNSEFVLYQGSDYEPILTKNEGNSVFYLNNSWESQSQITVMSEGSFIKPQESKSFKIPIQIPLYFGLQDEHFHLEDINKNVYANTNVNIKLDIARPDKKVVEITKTETGQLNVRDGAWQSSNVISRVTPGQRFLVLETTNTGWVKLDLGRGKSGWVTSRYTKEV